MAQAFWADCDTKVLCCCPAKVMTCQEQRFWYRVCQIKSKACWNCLTLRRTSLMPIVVVLGKAAVAAMRTTETSGAAVSDQATPNLLSICPCSSQHPMLHLHHATCTVLHCDAFALAFPQASFLCTLPCASCATFNMLHCDAFALAVPQVPGLFCIPLRQMVCSNPWSSHTMSQEKRVAKAMPQATALLASQILVIIIIIVII